MEKKTSKGGRLVLVIDDHPVFLEGLKTIVKRDGRFTIIGTAQNGRDGILLAETIKPDVVVMEIVLPDQDAFRVIYELRNLLPTTPVMILSAHSQVDYIIKALKCGASGYAMKDSSCESILNGLETVSNGDYYLDSTVSPDLVLGLNSPAKANGKATVNSNNALTPREQEIMSLLALGLSRKDTAKRLSISPRTVENHASNIMKKLSLKSTIELVRCAVKFGLIDVDDWKERPLTMEYPQPYLVKKA